MSAGFVAQLAFVAGLLAAFTALSAQQPTSPLPQVRISTGVTPDTVTVGDPFQALVSVAGPEGTRVVFPAVQDPAAAVEALAPVRVVQDPAAPDAVLAVYSLVAWTTGELAVPSVPVSVTFADGTEVIYRVFLRLPWVASVLPADLEGVEPRPPKEVFDRPASALMPVLLLILALLLLALAAYLLWRRRGAAAVVDLSPVLPPREQALALLEQARSSGLAEAGEWKGFFSLISGAVRGYLAALSPHWSPDLTTRELIERLGAQGADRREVEMLRGVLERADRVKFARYRPAPAEATESWTAAREWIETTEISPDAVAEKREAA